MKRIACIIQIMALLGGCEKISERLHIDSPQIVHVMPEHLSENMYLDADIIIEFSKAMDQMKTNQAFSLRSHRSGNIDGYFTWQNERTLVFSPRLPLSENCYTIRVDTSAEDTEGNDLREAHESVFYVATDLTPPEIVSHTPADNATGIHPAPQSDPERYSDSMIRIIFSEPIDIDSAFDGFSIMPSVPGLFHWNDTHTEMTFAPINDLLPGTTYTITLNTSLCDIHGNALRENYSYRFTIGDDFTPPEIMSAESAKEGSEPIALQEGIDNEGCEKDAAIVITFSEQVLREKVADAVRISPAKSLYIEGDTLSSQMTIRFSEALESECAYEFIIGPTITDAGGNSLTREYRYRFITNGAYSKRPLPACITDTRLGFSPPFENYECFAHGKIEPLTIYNEDEFLFIIFNKEINPTRMHLSISRVQGSSGSGLPKISRIDWPDEPFGEFRVYRFYLSGIDADNIYRITVRGGASGIEDAYGNTMKEDYHQFIKVQSN